MASPPTGTVSVPESPQRIATKVAKVTTARMPPMKSALVGVIGFTRHELHPIVGSIGQPSAEVALGKPASPADFKHLAKIKLVDGEKDENAQKPRDTDKLVPKHRTILVLQGAEERVIPLVEENIDVHHRERECHDDEEQPPGRPAVLREPVRADHGPGVGKRSAQASYGRVFGAIGRTGTSFRIVVR